jgi:predicted TIM-barrel fold metal-dependent hydrolase
VDPMRLADLPIVDGHIHFNHLARMSDILALMEGVPLVRANLVCTSNPSAINHNPALLAFKARFPDRAYISGALDFTQVLADPERMPAILAAQVHTLKAIGFDGLKMTEGKPPKRKWIPIPLDAPGYDGLWTALEALGMPVLLHVGDPETFWDPERCPARARERGWFYGDGTYPLKEELHAEAEHVLDRHPRLKVILAHFYFLSADLERAGRFLDAHPNACFDLAPGSEMYNNFSRDPRRTRDFFLRYQDRLIYGTDTTTGGLERDGEKGVERALGRAWVICSYLETGRAFTPPEGLERWLEPDLRGFQGIALPREVLERIYHTNVERLYGCAPAPLDQELALAEIRRMAVALDERAGDGETPNHARQVLEALNLA